MAIRLNSSSNRSSSKMARCGRCAALAAEVFDSLRDLRDPEFPAETLEELQVILPELIVVRCTGSCSRHKGSSSSGCSDSSVAYTEPWNEEDCSNCCSRCSSTSSSKSSSFLPPVSSNKSGSEEVEGCTPGCRCCCIVVSVHPTSPRCSFASMLGLLVRARLAIDFAATDAAALALNAAADSATGPTAAGGAWGALPFAVSRLSLWVRVCAHEASESLTKQLNDKERVAAALTTPSIRKLLLDSMQLEEY